jgi:two-component system, chemotaxis family, CheB/CheR fusion protein
MCLTVHSSGLPNGERMTEQIPDEEERELLSWLDAEQTGTLPSVDGTGLARIVFALRAHTGIDFDCYKPESVSRRVVRRMRELELKDMHTYTQRIQDDAHEATALAHYILVGVTRFLRDEGAIQSLRANVIPRLVERAQIKPLRLWVAGCSTGEEAYSLAMLLNEALDAVPDHLGWKLFATDIDGAAIEQASSGEFDPQLLEQLPQSLRERYFTPRGDRYVVHKRLREKLLFSRHDITQDPPFSHVDMVSCRNLLIYLKPNMQSRVLQLLSAALNDDGVLWLGASESLGERADEFKTLDARWRVYAARPNRKRDPMLFTTNRAAQTTEAARRMKKDDLSLLLETIHKVYVPPCLVIDSHFRLMYRFGELDALLRLPTGAVSLDVRDLLPEELSSLITALASKTRQSGDVVYRDLTAMTERGQRSFDLRACTLTLPDHGNLIALFFEGLSDVQVNPEAVARGPSDLGPGTRDRLDFLESELRQTRESLQATIEELESSNEEMQATNEELIAANEELQSTNEELQSVNDQLHNESSANGEKVSELNVANGDMERLLANLDVGIVLLDDKLGIRRFNPTATLHFNLLPQDVGRSLTHLSHRLRYENLVEDCQRALRDPAPPVWRSIQTQDGRTLQVQLRGYEVSEPEAAAGSRNLTIAVVAPKA